MAGIKAVFVMISIFNNFMIASSFIILTLITNNFALILKYILYIYYLVWFKKDKIAT